jgi:hypothetical protein
VKGRMACKGGTKRLWEGKNRHENQWIRIEDPEIKPHSYSQLIFDKGVKNTGKKTASSTNGAGKMGVYLQKTETRPLSPSSKINSKCIKDLNVKT